MYASIFIQKCELHSLNRAHGNNVHRIINNKKNDEINYSNKVDNSTSNIIDKKHNYLEVI